MGKIDLNIKVVLVKYNGVFEGPKGLPPKRNKDHKINIKKGTLPVFVRPYIYPSFFSQKSKIEKIVKELLDVGVIRSRQSPFS